MCLVYITAILLVCAQQYIMSDFFFGYENVFCGLWCLHLRFVLFQYPYNSVRLRHKKNTARLYSSTVYFVSWNSFQVLNGQFDTMSLVDVCIYNKMLLKILSKFKFEKLCNEPKTSQHTPELYNTDNTNEIALELQIIGSHSIVRRAFIHLK